MRQQQLGDENRGLQKKHDELRRQVKSLEIEVNEQGCSAERQAAELEKLKTQLSAARLQAKAAEDEKEEVSQLLQDQDRRNKKQEREAGLARLRLQELEEQNKLLEDTLGKGNARRRVRALSGVVKRECGVISGAGSAAGAGEAAQGGD